MERKEPMKLDDVRFCCDLETPYMQLGLEEPQVRKIRQRATVVSFKKPLMGALNLCE